MAQPLTGRLLGSEREHGSRAKGFSAGRSNRDFFFLLPSLYADTNSLKNISCGQERGTLLTAARCARAQGLPWVCVSLLGSRLLLLESPGRLPQALLPARRWNGMGWDGSRPAPICTPCPASPSSGRRARAVTRAGEQREQTRTIQGNQYLSRNTQASCQLSSNPI